jgi:hypothetical protein
MNSLIRHVLFIMPAIVFISCSSKAINIVHLDLPVHQNIILEIRSFSEAKKYMAAQGFKWRGTMTDLVNTEDKLFTSFEDKDFAQLRRLLIRSIYESQSFKAVEDIQDENQAHKGLCLYLCFDQSGIRQTMLEYFCFINACAWTAIKGDSLFAKKEIKTKGQSKWSAGRALNEAERQFVKEVGQLLAMTGF